MMDILLVVLGLGASTGFIATNYILNRTWMLIVQAIAIILVSTQYGIMGIWTVVAVNAVLLLRNLLFFAVKWNAKQLFVASTIFAGLLTLVTFTIVGIPSTLLDWIALFAGYFNILAFATLKSMLIKINLGLSSFSWATFNSLQGSWQNVIGDAFGTLAALIAIIRITRLRQTASTLKRD